MNPQSPHKPNLTALLQNELEILMAQIRLMELYVKQIQEGTADQIVGSAGQAASDTTVLQNRVVELEAAIGKIRASVADEIESIRQGFEVELTKLRGRLLVKDRALARAHEAITATEKAFAPGTPAPRDSEEARPGLDVRAADSVGAAAELKRLRSRIAAQEQSLADRERSIAELEGHLAGLSDELHRAGEEKGRLLGRATSERQDADPARRVHELAQRSAELELMQRQTERLLGAQAEQIRAGVRAEIERLELRLAEKEAAIQALQVSAQEAWQRHCAELDDLQQSLRKEQLLSASRKAEIAELKAQIAALEEKTKTARGADGNTVVQAKP